jgi:hypothetical protein
LKRAFTESGPAPRLLELAHGRFRVGRDERRTQVRVRVGVAVVEPHRFAELGDASRVVARLDEHEAEVVVGLAKSGRRRIASRNAAATSSPLAPWRPSSSPSTL